MTGLHTGHCPVRGNREIPASESKFGAGQLPLPEKIVTVAEVLKSAGYATACMGKWGMGQFDTTGSPLKQGFDHFFGYNGQVHAHSYFPTWLDNDEQRIELPENKGEKKTYAQNLIQKDLLAWVEKQKTNPFFLFYATTLPHGKYEIDDLGEYANRDGWTEQQKTYAAMVTRLDRDVGELLALLQERWASIRTRSFCLRATTVQSSRRNLRSANSSISRWAASCAASNAACMKAACAKRRSHWWPGVVPAGRVSEEPWAFWDFLPTAADLAGAKLTAEAKTDGLSLVSYLKGGPAPKRDLFLLGIARAELQAGRSIRRLEGGA